MRKLLCIMMSLAVLASSFAIPVLAEETDAATLTAAAETVVIASAEEFLRFAQQCRLDSYSHNKVFLLEADIDLNGTDFSGIPIFSGTFDGNGHTVTGLDISNAGSKQGLFRQLTQEAVVRDLYVEGTVAPTGSACDVGGIAGSNAGIISNCVFRGTVSGVDRVGGIAGSNSVTGMLINCSVSGSAHGSHFVGGIAGESNGVIRACRNHAQVNTTVEQNSISIEDISLESLTDVESAATVTDIGGICGTGTGVLRDCENYGSVGYRQVGYNIGGIAGSCSGYVTNCTNYGIIDGRKEVGGIVGQLEPAVNMLYDEDALQTLQGQMEQMSATTKHTAASAQSGASALNSQLSSLEEQLDIARDAISTLIPNEEDPQLPDADAILAAQNTLSSSMSSITGTLSSMGSTAEDTLGSVYRDLQSISGQMNAIGGTLGTASENLGGTIADVSDADTPEDTAAKIENCRNLAAVQGDWNVGGIAGAIALENDLDPEDDIQVSGSTSANFDCELRAVITSCENTGSILGKKQNAGGITGWMSMGLLKQCLNTADIDGASADYTGGIAGRSSGYIRSCLVKCSVSGDTYAGGIAGSGATVSDCRAMVEITDATEKAGAILGDTEEEYALQGNYYLSIGADIGAVDGISYAQCAEAMAAGEFLKLEELPESFGTITVTFHLEDGTATTVTAPFGGKLAQSQIPEIPGKVNYHGTWEGTTTPYAQLFFDTEFHAVYTPYITTLESGITGKNGLPVLLVQGAFTDNLQIAMSTLEQAGSIEAWALTLPESGEALQLRYLLPQDCDADAIGLQLRSAQGDWTETAFSTEGSYIVFSAPQDITALQLVQLPADYTLHIVIAAAAFCLVVLIVTASSIKKRRKK